MIHFLSGYHNSFSYFSALEVVKGPDFCVKLKKFPSQFHTFEQMDKNKLKEQWNGVISAVDARN